MRPNKAPADEAGQMSLGPVSTVRGSGRCSQGMEGEQILPKSRASHPLSHVILPTNTSYLILKRCVSYLKKAKWDFCHHSTAAQCGDVQSKHGRFDLLWPHRLILVLTQLPARNWNRRHWSATPAPCDHHAGFGVQGSTTEDGASHRTLVITFCGNQSFLCSTGKGPAV